MASKNELLAMPFLGAICSRAKVSLFQRLEQMPAGGMLLQVKKDEGMELVFKFHLQRSVAPGFTFRDANVMGRRGVCRCELQGLAT